MRTRFALLLVFLLFAAAPASAQLRDVTNTASLTAAAAEASTCDPTSCVKVELEGYNGVGVQLTGTWAGTITAEISIDDGTTYTAVNLINAKTLASTASVTVNGTYTFTAVGGARFAQIRASSFTIGIVGVFLRATAAWAPTPVALNADGGAPVHITNGSATVLDSPTFRPGSSGLAQVVGFGYGFDGNEWTRLHAAPDGSLMVTIAGGGIPVSGLPGTVKGPFGRPSSADSALVVTERDPIVLAPSPMPCPSVIAVNQTASTDLKTSTGLFSICSIVLVSATAQNISVIEGTGSNCGTGGTALIGGTTASVAVAANGGFSAVAAQPWLRTQVSGDHLCVLQSGAGNVSGVITYRDAS